MAACTHRTGLALCLASSAGFGAMAIVAKDAYASGAGVLTLLAVRFVLAAGALWAIAAARGGVAVLRRPVDRRVATRALMLGAVVYAAEAGLFYAALSRMDASVTELLLYVYPGVVLLAAAALGREALTGARGGALALASAGVALVLLDGSGGGGLDGLGVVLALGAAVAYAGYVLAADRLGRTLDPLVLAALITTGAGVALTAAGAATGTLDLALGARGWADAVALALGCTVLPLTTLYAGLRRVGPSTASIVSCVEPVFTVALAVALLGERLSPLQAAGGAVVLGAVALLQRRGTVARDVPAPVGPPAAPARALAGSAAH